MTDQRGGRPLETFANILGRYLHGIPASTTRRLNTSVLHGAYTRAEVTKRRLTATATPSFSR